MQINGRDIYVNIKEIPLINQVQAGDFFIVETTQGTNIVDFSNIIIPPENTSFYNEIENLQTDVANLSTLIQLQTVLVGTVSSILDTKFTTASSQLSARMDTLSAGYYEDFRFVQGGGSWQILNSNDSQLPGTRCTWVKNDIGNYTITFTDVIAAAVASSDADITYVKTTKETGIVTVETYELSYSFDISAGNISAVATITAIDTLFEKVPVDPINLSVIAF